MSHTLHPQYRFDTLVVGAANRLAVTAARAVAEAPGAVYNPLCIYAPPGLGKTHLLMALGHAVGAVNPHVTVEYLTLDGFVEAYTAAVGAGQGDAFRRRFAEVGVLLLDDVQFLGQHREMQAELLRAMDGMQAAGRQIVLTSDRPPADIEALDERLLRDPRRDPAPQGGGAPRHLRARRARGGGGSADRQRARADRRAQPADRLPGGE